MTTINPELRDKIERRARRAWRDHRDGAKRRSTRISDVTDDELKYRLPYTPDYYGKEKIRVVRLTDGTIDVDPKTKGPIDCLQKNDLDRLKKHGDIVRAYIVSKSDGKLLDSKHALKVGADISTKTARALKSREQCLSSVNPGDRVFVVELHADIIEGHRYGEFDAKRFTVIDELDQEKDLGFTVGLVDCRSKGDLDKLKKHIGDVRSYVLKKRVKKSITLGKKHTLKTGERFRDYETVSRLARPGDKVYVAEFNYSEIEKQHTDGLTATVPLIEELDPVTDLGFVPGAMIDLVSSSDLLKLKDHKGMVRAYKYVTKDFQSPTQSPQITYAVGEDFEVANANTDPKAHCAAGINVASQEWCKSFAKASFHRALAFEFHTDDIAAIPTDGGKLRVFRCLCVEEVDVRTYKSTRPETEDKAEAEAETETETKAAPKSPQDDLDDLCASDDQPVKKPKKKKKGFIEKLFGSKDEGGADGV